MSLVTRKTRRVKIEEEEGRFYVVEAKASSCSKHHQIVGLAIARKVYSELRPAKRYLELDHYELLQRHHISEQKSQCKVTINAKMMKKLSFHLMLLCIAETMYWIVEQLCFWLATVKLCSRVGKSMLEWIEDKLFSLSVTTLSHCDDTSTSYFFERTF